MGQRLIISYDCAVRLTGTAATRLPPATVPLREAVGRVTTRAVLSREVSPNADLAAMDGYAVRASELRDAAPEAPRRLDLIGSVAAGDAAPKERLRAAAGCAVRIATGALMPAGYDTVLPFEQVSETSDGIEVPAPAPAGANVRRTGEDHRPGDVVLEAGRRIGPSHVLLLANLGCSEVEVVRRPRVAVLATGSEVVEDLSLPLRPGQVRNSNARYLLSALAVADCAAKSAGTVPDRPEAVAGTLRRLLEVDPPPDLVLTIGGVSRGAADFVPAALDALGAEYLFRGVALRPGKPVLWARLPGSGTLLFGLPGNPLAVLATFRALVVPCLRTLQGLPPEPPAMAVLDTEVCGRPALTRLLLAHPVGSAAGAPERIVAAARQQASQVGALRNADRWLVVPPDRARLPAGSDVATLPL